MNNQDTQDEFKEVRETLSYLHQIKNEPTSILIAKLFIHPHEKSDLWVGADGLFEIIEGIFDEDVKNELKGIHLPVHLTTSFTINFQFEVPVLL